MALKPDDTVCYCFHVPLRKIENFCRIEKPRYPSQISQCLSAGTGCGWCRPVLRKVHQRLCGANDAWWRKEPGDERSAPPVASTADTADIDAQTYAAARQKYLAANQITPPKP